MEALLNNSSEPLPNAFLFGEAFFVLGSEEISTTFEAILSIGDVVPSRPDSQNDDDQTQAMPPREHVSAQHFSEVSDNIGPTSFVCVHAYNKAINQSCPRCGLPSCFLLASTVP